MRFLFTSSSADVASLAASMAQAMAPRGVACLPVAEGPLSPALPACLGEVGLAPVPCSNAADEEASSTWLALNPRGAPPAPAPAQAEVWPLPPVGEGDPLVELRVVREVLRERLRRLLARKEGGDELVRDPWRVQARKGALEQAGSASEE